jgi:hypothetical protein
MVDIQVESLDNPYVITNNQPNNNIEDEKLPTSAYFYQHKEIVDSLVRSLDYVGKLAQFSCH